MRLPDTALMVPWRARFFRRMAARSVPVILLGVGAMVASIGIYGQSPAAAANVAQASTSPVPLEGMDPVLLVGGEERQGKLEIHADHGGFRYLFASAATRARFLEQPDRYSVQAGGVCARMGPEHPFCLHGQYGPGVVHPEIWAVVRGRIYLFWSMDCRKAFLEAPDKYLEPAPAPLPSAQENVRRGRALIEKAVAAAGGAKRLDALRSYIMTSSQTIAVAGKEFPGTATVHWTRPSHARLKLEGGPYTQITSAVPDKGFAMAVFQGMGRFDTSLVEAQRARFLRNVAHYFNPLGLLLMREAPGFQAVALDTEPSGALRLARLAIRSADAAATLGIDDEGRVRTLEFADRGPDGAFGERLLTFDDFRVVDGLSIPHAVTGRFNGKPDPGWTWTVTSMQLDQDIDPAIFDTRK